MKIFKKIDSRIAEQNFKIQKLDNRIIELQQTLDNMIKPVDNAKRWRYSKDGKHKIMVTDMLGAASDLER